MQIRRKRGLWAGLAALLLASGLVLHFGLPDFSGITALERSIDSRLLGESRPYLVYLPHRYRAGEATRYRVVYVLDGADQAHHTARAVAELAASGAFPEAIVVGIPNTGAAGRNRDLTPPGMRQDEDSADTGRSDRFLQFLRGELVPAVEGEFGGSGRRVLAGNSRGGLFVVDAMSRDPSLFDAYLANSPALWREDRRALAGLRDFLRVSPAPRACLYLSIGADENARMLGAFHAATAVLRTDARSGLRWHAVETPGAEHGDNAERATPRALAWIAANCEGI